ncbi:MAG: hypothetical protein SGILL_005207 [Bacillariaceae sp.]
MTTPADSKAPKGSGCNTNTSAAAVDDADGDAQFTALPSTVLLVGVCSFLRLEDIFTLRLTSPKVLAMLHHGEGQDELWKLVLQRDFGFSAADLEDGPVRAVKMEDGQICRLSTDMTEPCASHFDSVKKWTQLSTWFYAGCHTMVPRIQTDIAEGEVVSAPAMAMAMGIKPFVHAPYFLRAANFWESLTTWFESGSRVPAKDARIDPDEEREVRLRIQQSLSPLRTRYFDFLALDKPGFLARQAVSAFCSGTATGTESLAPHTYAVLGGYGAYDRYRLNALFGDGSACIVTSNALNFFTAIGCIRINAKTGELYVHGIPGCKPVQTKNQSSSQDELLLWLDEYARRLLEGEIGIGELDTSIHAVTLFPRYVPGSAPRMANGIPVVSRKVTKGVEVIASAIYVPLWQDDMGFVYSIRIRLLTQEDDDEYVSSGERGFLSCQLLQRHWRIVNDEEGRTQNVDGDGVLGMTPVLKEYGYTKNGEDHYGTFQYQSCTGPLKRGSFGGHLTFEARPASGTTFRFDVEVGAFALDSEPDFLFC